MGAGSDYEKIARAIRFLDSLDGGQPPLAEVAAHAGLSPFHFERLFVRWAGVSPKKYLQFRAKELARARLVESAPVLDAALEAGLSGPGRLHDLLVTFEGVTPGELKSRGAGLDIRRGIAESPFGPCAIGETGRGVCALHFGEDLEPIARDWPRAKFLRDDARARELAAQIFREGGTGGLRAFVRGTRFQLSVWEALLRIPPGQVTTYGAIARAIGKAGAARAVGGAVGSNPISWLIPCHRVIRESGALGGYRWGTERKSAMLFRENRAGSRPAR